MTGNTNETNRYEELDSLRGIASLTVFFGHMLILFNGSLLTLVLFEYGPLRVTVASTEAVMLFFVLSGFVLSLPFYSKKQFNYVSYTIKRICRIYLPYFFAIVLAYVCKELFYGGEIIQLSNWFNDVWDKKITSEDIFKHLLLIITFSSKLNVVVWSLVHEMRISIIFPLIMFLLMRVNSLIGFGMASFFSLSSVIYVYLSGDEPLLTGVIATLHYSSLFILGAILAKNREYLIEKFKGLSSKIRIITFLLGVVLFVYAHPSFVLNMIIPDFKPFYRTVIDSWFIGIGACILIISALSAGNFSRILKNKVINYLGKISYSLYLTHLIVLISSMHLLFGKLPTWSICVLALVITVLLSSLMYETVEKNSIKLGKKITEKASKKGKENLVNHNTSS